MFTKVSTTVTARHYAISLACSAKGLVYQPRPLFDENGNVDQLHQQAMTLVNHQNAREDAADSDTKSESCTDPSSGSPRPRKREGLKPLSQTDADVLVLRH